MTHMQLDGEPWPQIIPAGDKTPLMVCLICYKCTLLLCDHDLCM